jgi:GNAT superfamily N-acetyltransferase
MVGVMLDKPATTTDLKYRELRGPEIVPFLPQLARLRIEVFREYPYLYDGDLSYEEAYLKTYVEAPDCLVVLLEVDDRVVGATTGLPMPSADPEFHKPFRQAGIEIDQIFYFGESVILPDYRGHGAGNVFFDRRESHAQRLGFSITTFCAVDRGPEHPHRPENYRPLDAFWSRRGYERRPDLQCVIGWKELDEPEESPKSLTFWIRDLTLCSASGQP